MSENTVLEAVCTATKYALLRYANEERDLSGFPQLAQFSGDAPQFRIRQIEHGMMLERALLENPKSRYVKLLNWIGSGTGAELAKKTLNLCILEHCLPSYGLLITPLQELPECSGVTVELAVRVFMGGDIRELGPSVGVYSECLAAFRLLEPYLVADDQQEACYRKRLKVDSRLIGWLSGDDQIEQCLENTAKFYFADPALKLPPLFTANDLADKIVTVFKRASPHTPVLLQLRGEKGSGRKFVLRHVGARLKRPILMVSCQELIQTDVHERSELIWKVQREALLYRCMICWTDFEPDQISPINLMKFCILPFMKKGISLCVTTGYLIQLEAVADIGMTVMEMPNPTRLIRIATWEGFAALAGIKMNCVNYGVKYRMSAAEIERAVKQLSLCYKGETVLDDQIVSQVCMDVLPTAVSGSLRLIRSSCCFEDLKLPAEQKKALLSICAHVWQSHTVFDEWALAERFPYGRGVTALFVGPPGTGKTMAAYVLSNMLEIPLYRVEISQVVDKYIGETEKHLEEIFCIAEKSNSILFFDEADSLFGKRSEVSDAKDKYANTEVSYILQRIEQYEGIVILASNYKRNIDEAFMRRMRYLIDFQLPNAEIRREIWMNCFTEQTPTSGLDFDFLAQKFELSGGSIKNIALNAAFLAASEGSEINMNQIFEEIRAENLKFGKTMLKTDFGIYSYLLDSI